MKQSASSIALLIGAILVAGCSKGGPSREEIREFDELEHALGALSNAPKEDRDIRIKQLGEISIKTERVLRVRDLCVESYRLFGESARLLHAARSQTLETETKLAEAWKLKERDGGLPAKNELALQQMSAAAAKSLENVTVTLDKAEKAVAACQDARSGLRDYFSSR